MKISASLYSGVTERFQENAKYLESIGVDMYHIDCNDRMEVFEDIRWLKSHFRAPIDLHIVSTRPSVYTQAVLSSGVQYVTYQIEQIPDNFEFPRHENLKVGLALVSDTPLEALAAYVSSIDFILIMTTVPGQSGGVFSKDNFQRIRRCGQMYPGVPIHVDGGVNDEVSFVLRNLGVSVAVSGSFLMKNDQALALSKMKHGITGSSFHVKDMMMPTQELPVLDSANTSLQEILVKIEEYKLGFCLFCDEEGRFQGICSHADLRKGLIKNLPNLNATSPGDIINPNCITVQEDHSIAEMLGVIARSKSPLLFVPVLSSDARLSGAVMFNQLIKGEG